MRSALSVALLGSLFLLSATCSAPSPTRPTASGGSAAGGSETGGDPPECPCTITGRNEWGIALTDLGCLCEHLGCPLSPADARGPSSVSKVWALQCDGATSYAHTNSFGGVAFTFDRGGALIGARFSADYPAYCGAPDIEAGELLTDRNPCDGVWCLQSWGPKQIADPGTCLDPEDLVDPNDYPIGTGGAGGASPGPTGGLGGIFE
jgi:hypothetical protein